jgi:hypothetical protein
MKAMFLAKDPCRRQRWIGRLEAFAPRNNPQRRLTLGRAPNETRQRSLGSAVRQPMITHVRMNSIDPEPLQAS